jgi:hypothetical protein
MHLLTDITPLREHPAFRRLWLGTMLSRTGSAMTTFAITLQVYDLTRPPAAGLVGSLTTPVISALSGGLLTVFGVLVIGAALPGFRRYRP